MRKLWLSVSVEDSQHMIDMLDVNHDNRVSMDEFRRFVYLLPESLVSLPAQLVHRRVSGLTDIRCASVCLPSWLFKMLLHRRPQQT